MVILFAVVIMANGRHAHRDPGVAVSRILSSSRAPVDPGVERIIRLSGRYPKPGVSLKRAASKVSYLALHPRGVFRALPITRKAVGSYPAFSPLPPASRRRFIFCGTFRVRDLSTTNPARISF